MKLNPSHSLSSSEKLLKATDTGAARSVIHENSFCLFKKSLKGHKYLVYSSGFGSAHHSPQRDPGKTILKPMSPLPSPPALWGPLTAICGRGASALGCGWRMARCPCVCQNLSEVIMSTPKLFQSVYDALRVGRRGNKDSCPP